MIFMQHSEFSRSLRSQVWRFGCTIYAALTAAMPFAKEVWCDGEYRKLLDRDALATGRLDRDGPEWQWSQRVAFPSF